MRGNKVANDDCPAGKARATVGQKTKNQQKAHWMLDELWSLAQIFLSVPILADLMGEQTF